MRDELDALVARADGAMVIVTAAAHEQRAGCLVGFHVQCSIEPFRYAVWLSKANHTLRVALFATHFAVHFLTDQHVDVARLFGTSSGDDVDKFSQCDWHAGPAGVPLLTGIPAAVFERASFWNDASDHVCLIGVPVAVQSASRFRPLRLSEVHEFQPGHEATDRPIPNASAAD
jgi:flavin reductase (DIM6/NTAB) family NADH-FMN oxidoreductase RutF